jgi:hypothetical protein
LGNDLRFINTEKQMASARKKLSRQVIKALLSLGLKNEDIFIKVSIIEF